MNADSLNPAAGVQSSVGAIRLDLVEESSFTPVRGSGGMRYRPLKQLGAGGMARVMLACGDGPSGFTKLVVLKVMRKEILGDASAREMFLSEARLSARLNHPNLVQVNEVIQGAELPYLVMEHLDGKPLSAIKLGAGFDQSMMLTVITEALIGLHHAHELRDYDGTPLSVVHRDVSPQNVFVTYDGVVKVLDFGIAKAATSESRTLAGEIKGKLTYMAPEQLLGQSVDRRADIFSVGCMLWEAAVGGRLWEDMPAANLMHHLATGNIPRPSTRASIDAELERIIIKATAADREDRYSSALELQREMDAYLVQSGRRRALRDVGAALAQRFRGEREEQSELIRRALRDPSGPKSGSMGSKAEVAYELSVSTARPRRNWFFALAGVMASIGVALFALSALERFRPAHEPGSELPPTPAKAPTVSIQVRATPAHAVISLDGKMQGSGNITLDVPPEARQRFVQVSAPGFASETRVLAFDRTQILDLALEKLPERPAAAPAVSADLRTVPEVKTPRLSTRAAPRVQPAATAAKDKASCTPPYYFVNGIKTFKPECI